MSDPGRIEREVKRMAGIRRVGPAAWRSPRHRIVDRALRQAFARPGSADSGEVIETRLRGLGYGARSDASATAERRTT